LTLFIVDSKYWNCPFGRGASAANAIWRDDLLDYVCYCRYKKFCSYRIVITTAKLHSSVFVKVFLVYIVIVFIIFVVIQIQLNGSEL
jgi:hypothetical protein